MLELGWYFNVVFYRLFNEYEDYDYARTGSTATEKVLPLCTHDLHGSLL